MSAEVCCTKTLDMGCWSCCQRFIELPIVYPSTGQFKVWYKYAGRRLFRVMDGVQDEPVIIPVSGLNEEFTFYGYITDPDGNAVSFMVGGTVYDCFSFRFHEGVELQPEPNPGTCSGVDILDGDGNVIAHIADGGTYTVMNEILPYADEAAALADTTTIPANNQKILLQDTGREYWQTDRVTPKNVSQLVTAKRFLLPVTEDASTGFHATLLNADVTIQTNS